MKVLSCDYVRLYASGGLYDDSLDSRAPLSAATWLANVDQPYSYRRPMPLDVISANDDTRTSLEETYRTWNEQHNQGPSSDLFSLENAVLFNRTVHVPEEGEWASIYETDRPFERHFKTERLTPDLLENVLKARASDTSYLYLGTVGSENYAHWLVDDLTRARVVPQLLQQGPVTILLDSYFEAIDRVRRESLQALLGEDERLTIMFIDKKRAFFFERMLYVSPNTFHPFLKCPAAIADLHDRLRRPNVHSPKRLFVGRKALWRNLLNQDEVVAALSPLGFTAVTIESMSFETQIEWFSNAETIVGVSGASMGNTVFAPDDASVVYLAGEGFIDPFYWDLAALRRQRYSVCFGSPWKPEKPTFSSFTLGTSELDRLIKLVATTY